MPTKFTRTVFTCFMTTNTRKRRRSIAISADIQQLDRRQLLAAAMGDTATEESEHADVDRVRRESREQADQLDASTELDSKLTKEEIAKLEELRKSMPDELSPNAEEPSTGQAPVDDFLGEMSLAYDEVAELAGTDAEAFIKAFDALFSEYAQIGGLDGRNDTGDSSGVQDPNATPGTVGANAFGGWYAGPGSTTDDNAGEEPSLWSKIVEWFGGNDADNPDQQGSGDVGGNLSSEVDGAMAGSAAAVEGLKSSGPNAGAGGRVTGGLTGILAGILTANTDSPDSKTDEFNGWAALFAAAKGKAPLAGGSSLDAETAATVRDGDDFREDRTQDAEGLPSHLQDPTEGWGDIHNDKKWEVALGGGITNPNPMNDPQGASMGDPQSMDPTDLVADYADPVIQQTLPTTIRDNRDWEF